MSTDREKIAKFMRDGYVSLAAATVLMSQIQDELTDDEIGVYAKMTVLMEEIGMVWGVWPSEPLMH